MFIRRMFHWSCAFCGKVTINGDYGLPKGWIAIPAKAYEKKTRHACPDRKDTFLGSVKVVASDARE